MNILNINRNTKRWISMVADLILFVALVLFSKSSFIRELNNEVLNTFLSIVLFILFVKGLYSATKIILNIGKKEEQKQ